ncbi:MAG TPA: ROK family protein [Pseudogracilibacillus sp.]|nr:ROK family protein [Pseudogracilibacillus sp.]
MKVLGIDIGGTSIKAGLVDESGHVTQFIEFDTEAAKGGPYVLDNVIAKVKESFTSFDAIGVSTLGQVDLEGGFLAQNASNIPNTKDLPIKAKLEEVFQVPVTVENDVNAAALGESAFGIGKDYDDILYLTYGTGIGGAIVIDSNLYYGKSGFAGEFGHMPTHAFGRPCGCGQKGCYEKYAATTALVAAAKEVDPKYENGRLIFAAYHEGEETIIELVHGWIKEIAVGLVTLIHSFNPSTIVLGGGVMEQDFLVEKIEKTVNDFILESFRHVHIISATLGNKAGLLGAASKHFNRK